MEPFSGFTIPAQTEAAIFTATGKSKRIKARETLSRRRAAWRPSIFSRPSRRKGRASGTREGQACSIARTARIHGSFGIASSEPRKSSPPASRPSRINIVARSSAASESRPFAPASASSESERSSCPSEGGCGAACEGSASAAGASAVCSVTVGSATGATGSGTGTGSCFATFSGFAGLSAFTGSSSIPRSLASMIARFTGVGRFLDVPSIWDSVVSSAMIVIW